MTVQRGARGAVATRREGEHRVRFEGPRLFVTVGLVSPSDFLCTCHDLLPHFLSWPRWLRERTLGCEAQGSPGSQGQTKARCPPGQGRPRPSYPQRPAGLPLRERKQTGFIFSSPVGP